MSYQTRVTEVCQREREITKIYTPWSQDIMYTPDRGKEKYAHIYLLNSYIPFTDKPMQYISSTMHIIAFWDVQAFSLPSRKHLTQYNVNRKSFFFIYFPPPPLGKIIWEKTVFKKSTISLILSWLGCFVKYSLRGGGFLPPPTHDFPLRASWVKFIHVTSPTIQKN